MDVRAIENRDAQFSIHFSDRSFSYRLLFRRYIVSRRFHLLHKFVEYYASLSSSFGKLSERCKLILNKARYI